MIVPFALAATGWEVGCLSGTPAFDGEEEKKIYQKRDESGRESNAERRLQSPTR